MKQVGIGVLVALLPWAAQAEGVTVYGVARGTVENVRANGCAAPGCDDVPARQRLTTSGSRLGVRGQEPLGQGLRALFQFESSVGFDGGGAALLGRARDSFVGLAGAWGAVKLGVVSSPLRELANDLDLSDGNTGIAASDNLLGRMQSARTNHDAGFTTRLPNALLLESASFAGVRASVLYGANENRDASGRSDHTLGLGLRYGRGPFELGYAWERRADADASGLDGDERATGQRLGAQFDYGPGRVLAAWDRSEIDLARAITNAGDFSGRIRRDAWTLGASLRQGPFELWGQYAVARRARIDGNADFAARFGDGTATGARQIALGVDYRLSKRTELKAYVMRLSNEDTAWYDFTGAPDLDLGRGDRGADPRGFGLGLRHGF